MAACFSTLIKVVLFLLFFVPAAFSTEIPDAPEGYSWVQVKEIKAAFLVPASWYFTFKSSADQNMYSISKDRVEDLEDVHTGLTVIVRRAEHLKKYGDILPSELADLLMKKAKNNSELERSHAGEQGPFYTVRYQDVHEREGKGTIREYNLLLANDTTRTLYILTFVSPVAEWDAAWEIATVILQNMIIDDEI